MTNTRPGYLWKVRNTLAIECPDCGASFLSRQVFIAHRETEHPPTPIQITGAGGIESRTAFGTDPDPKE